MITAQMVRRHAERLVGTLDDGVRELIWEDPEETVTELLDIRVVHRPPAAATSDCSVDGSYDPQTRTIVVADSVSVGRRHFSVLHELGHSLFLRDDHLQDLAWDNPQAAQGWEESICDAIAAELLLPAHVVDAHIEPAGPTADDVIRLHQATRASREACAVRASQKLGAPGYVVVADLDGTVRFAARAMTPYPVARGAQQATDHPLAAAGRNGASRRADVRLHYPSGQQTDAHHADCTRDGDYVFGVFTIGRPPWPVIGLTRLSPTTREAPEYFCERCQDPYTNWDPPCPTCRDRRCPDCGWCTCRAPGADGLVRCLGCGLSFTPDHMVEDRCRDCR